MFFLNVRCQILSTLRDKSCGSRFSLDVYGHRQSSGSVWASQVQILMGCHGPAGLRDFGHFYDSIRSLFTTAQQTGGSEKEENTETFYCRTVTSSKCLAFQSSYFTKNGIWSWDGAFFVCLFFWGGGMLGFLQCTNEPRHLLRCIALRKT